MLHKSSRLTVTTTSDVVLLNSSGATDTFEDETVLLAEPTVLRGYVTISIAKARTIKSLSVHLDWRQTLNTDGYAHGYTMKIGQCDILSKPEVLLPGTHNFPWAISVPANTAPSDRTPYGRTSHKIVAAATGLSHLQKTVTAEADVTIIPVHSDPSGLPPGHHLETVAHNHNLGEVHVDLYSKHLLTSGFVQLNLFLPNILKNVHIEEVRVNVEQQYDMESLDTPVNRRPYLSRVDVIPIFASSPEDLKGGRQKAGSSLSLSKHVRMLDDTRIKPTTPLGTVTAIRIGHRLAVTIIYNAKLNGVKQERKEYRIASPATISSCHAMLDALQLPAYSEDNDEVAQVMIQKKSRPTCLCTFSTAKAISEYGAKRDVEHIEDITPAMNWKAREMLSSTPSLISVS